MAEFLAIHQSDASLLGCLLRRLAGRLTLGDAEPSAGVGFFQSDDVLLRKRPLSGQPAAPERLADGVESEAVLVSAGAVAAPGAVRAFHEEQTLPFRFKRWLFALAGNPDALAPARAALSAALPDYLRRSAKGDSAAEALFLMFLARLREAGKLDDFEVDAGTAARSLAGAVGVAERAFETLGQEKVPMAVLVTNGRVLAALRRGHPLWVGRVEGMTECARCELSARTSPLDPRVRGHRSLRGVMVASGASAPEGFTEVAEGGIVAISRGYEVTAI